MPVSDYSLTPSENLTLGTISLAEGATMVGDTNGALRQIMADVRAFYNGVPAPGSYVTPSDGIFSGTQPIYTGRGAFAHNTNPAYTSCKITDIELGAPMPAGALPGDIVFELAA